MPHRPKRLTTLASHGVRAARHGHPEQQFGHWLVVGIFSMRLRDRANLGTLIQALAAFCGGQEDFTWVDEPVDPGGEGLLETRRTWLVVSPDNPDVLALMEQWTDVLDEDEGTVLNEDHFLQLVSEVAERAWRDMTIAMRLRLLDDCDEPPHLARETELPDEVRGHLEDDIIERFA